MKKVWEVPSILEVSTLPEALGDCLPGQTPSPAEGGCHDGSVTSATGCFDGASQLEPGLCHTGGQAGYDHCVVGNLIHQWAGGACWAGGVFNSSQWP